MPNPSETAAQAPTEDLTKDLATIARQEAELTFPTFDYDTAWRLGLSLRTLAVQRGQSIVIDIRRFGQPHQPLFYAALAGTTPDNARWVQRKSNVVARFHRSSFPILITGTGILGSITVSGLPQREDHNLVVEALCLELKRDHDALRLP
jgi:uncharacterized protein (UPF0303 family)